METEFSPLVRAPLEEPGFLVQRKRIERAGDCKFCGSDACGIDVEVQLIGAQIVISTCPESVSDRIDDRTFPGVVGTDQNVETRREFYLQWQSRVEASKALRKDF
nr:hypothetical protein [Agrobacterium sp. DSM 25558]